VQRENEGKREKPALIFNSASKIKGKMSVVPSRL
jgi:hypothetical protein